MQVEINLQKGQRSWVGVAKRGEGGTWRHRLTYYNLKNNVFCIFYFYETIYNFFQIHRYTVIICPQGLARNDLLIKSAWRRFLSPLSSGQSVSWVVHLGCSLPWWLRTESNGRRSQASSDNYYNHTIMVLQVDVFFHNTSRKLFTSGMMDDSQAQFRKILWCWLMADT